ncbi:MAG: hypothetical protein ACLPSO_16835 [Terracidiphilus sp.]
MASNRSAALPGRVLHTEGAGECRAHLKDGLSSDAGRMAAGAITMNSTSGQAVRLRNAMASLSQTSAVDRRRWSALAKYMAAPMAIA